MKVILYFTYTEDRGGVYTYAFSTLNALILNEKIIRIIVITSSGNTGNLKKLITNKKVIFVEHKCSLLQKTLLSFSSLLYDFCDIKPKRKRLLWKAACSINPFNRLVDSFKADVLHIPSLVSPGYGMKTPIVLTMHDFQELHFPEFFTPYQRLVRTLLYKRSIENSNHLIVSFTHVKDDIIKYFNVSPNKISVCFNSDVGLWFIGMNPANSTELKNKYKLPDNFIIYPSKTWPHKNHQALLYSLDILKKKNVTISLVLTGAISNYYNFIENKAREMNLSEQIYHLGLVSREELAGLYKMASATVMPSLYEAGGGPLFEAMYFECPVISSDITSMPETMGNDSFLFHPNDYYELAEKIEKIVFDEEFRNLSRENSKKRMEFYLNYNSSDAFYNAYQQAINIQSFIN
jgi:glycosyltransferase involved in cell wall biosynthesis